MRIRDQGGTWGAWLPFAASSPWTLPAGDGTKTVEVEYHSWFGQTPDTVLTDDIVLDTVAPATKATAAVTGRRGKTVTLKYQVVDPVPNGGTATVTIKIKYRAGKVVKTLKPGVKAVNTALTAKLTIPRTWKPGVYHYYVYAKDAAGHAQAKIGSNRLTVK